MKQNDKQNVALGDADVKLAAETLERYRAGKSRLDSRISEESVWWRNRHGGAPSGDVKRGIKPVSA